MKVFKRIVILSAELKSLEKHVNYGRTQNLKRLLDSKKYNYVEALGSYKGSQEKSFVVDASEDIIQQLRSLADFFKQESILVVDELQKATLIYCNGKKESIGEMISVSSLKGLENWTMINNDLMYTVK